jgi:hypothetical protein
MPEQAQDFLNGKGINAKAPQASLHPNEHIGFGTRPDTNWLSATHNLGKAGWFGVQPFWRQQSLVVQIDLAKVRRAGHVVFDVSRGLELDGNSQRFAKNSEEVLINDHIPYDAMQMIGRPTRCALCGQPRMIGGQPVIV